MIKIVTVISYALKESLRRIKVLVSGKSNVQTAYESMPFGVDGAAPEGWRAVHVETGEDGKSVIIGYINKGQLETLARGEHRIYSTDSDGVLSTFIYLRGDGTMEVGGNADFMVRYNALETAFNQLKTERDDTATKLNAVINLLKTWTVVPNDGGAALKAAAAALTTTSGSTADISGAKINEIKTL